jgi:hypothetical protein
MILKSIRALILIAVVLLLGGCVKSTKVISHWQADKDDIDKRDRIAVIAMMPEALQRLTVEQEIVKVIRKSGGNALVSSDIPGLSGRLTRETAEPALRAASVQAVIVLFLTSGQKGEKLERADYYTQLVGSGFYAGGYGWFSPTYANVYTVVEGPGYYDQQLYVYVETTYFDIADDAPKWSMMTRATDIETQDAALGVAKKIVDRLRASGTL